MAFKVGDIGRFTNAIKSIHRVDKIKGRRIYLAIIKDSKGNDADFTYFITDLEYMKYFVPITSELERAIYGL